MATLASSAVVVLGAGTEQELLAAPQNIQAVAATYLRKSAADGKEIAHLQQQMQELQAQAVAKALARYRPRFGLQPVVPAPWPGLATMNKRLTAEVAELKARVAELEHQADLSAGNQKLLQELAAVRLELEISQDETAAMMDEKFQLWSQLKAQADDLRQAKADAAEAQAEAEEAGRQVERLEREVLQRASWECQLERELAGARDEVNALQRIITRVQLQADSCSQALAEAAAAKAVASTYLQQTAADGKEIVHLQQQMQEAAAQMARLADDRAVLQQQVQELVGSNTTLYNINSTLQQQVSNLQQEQRDAAAAYAVEKSALDSKTLELQLAETQQDTASQQAAAQLADDRAVIQREVSNDGGSSEASDGPASSSATATISVGTKWTAVDRIRQMIQLEYPQYSSFCC